MEPGELENTVKEAVEVTETESEKRFKVLSDINRHTSAVMVTADKYLDALPSAEELFMMDEQALGRLTELNSVVSKTASEFIFKTSELDKEDPDMAVLADVITDAAHNLLYACQSMQHAATRLINVLKDNHLMDMGERMSVRAMLVDAETVLDTGVIQTLVSHRAAYNREMWSLLSAD